MLVHLEEYLRSFQGPLPSLKLTFSHLKMGPPWKFGDSYWETTKFRKLTCPIWGKGKSSSNMPFLGDMLVPWRVFEIISGTPPYAFRFFFVPAEIHLEELDRKAEIPSVIRQDALDMRWTSWWSLGEAVKAPVTNGSWWGGVQTISLQRKKVGKTRENLYLVLKYLKKNLQITICIQMLTNRARCAKQSGFVFLGVSMSTFGYTEKVHLQLATVAFLHSTILGNPRFLSIFCWENPRFLADPPSPTIQLCVARNLWVAHKGQRNWLWDTTWWCDFVVPQLHQNIFIKIGSVPPQSTWGF